MNRVTRAGAFALALFALPLGGCLSTGGSSTATSVGSVLGGIKAGLLGVASVAPAACTDAAVVAGLANTGVAIAATAPAAGVTSKTTANVTNAGNTIVKDCNTLATALQTAGQAAAAAPIAAPASN